jgi:hypothetical protein
MANAREKLKAAELWLSMNKESLSDGLRSAFDALRLYDYAQMHPELPEMADEWQAKHRISAVGYDPLSENPHEKTTTGAVAVVLALQSARKLLDSVAFVAKEGDSKKTIRLIDAVLP